MAKLSLSPPTIPRSAPPTAAEHAAAVDDAREEAASAALAAAADFAGAAPEGARCYICLEGGAGLVRGCACRGTAGYAHVGCLAAHARNAHTFEPVWNQVLGAPRHRRDVFPTI